MKRYTFGWQDARGIFGSADTPTYDMIDDAFLPRYEIEVELDSTDIEEINE